MTYRPPPRVLAAWLAVLALAAVVPWDLAPLLRGPAPYPPEWQWSFEPATGGPPWLALVAAGLLVGLTALAEPIVARGRWGLPLALCSVVVLGWTFAVGLQVRDGHGALRGVMTRVLSRSITSYHSVACSPEARDPLWFLRQHAETLPALATTAKHAATHPPGPVLYYRGFLALAAASPALTTAALDWAGVSDAARQGPLRDARASALLGGLGTFFLAALTAVPAFFLARTLGAASAHALRIGALVPLLPGMAAFSPPWDQAVALPVITALALLATAVSAPSTQRALWFSIAAGAVGGLALFMSYGAAVFLGVGGGALLAWASRGPGTARRMAVAVLISFGTCLVAFLLPAVLGHAPLRSAQTALRLHRELWTAPRSYPLWVVFNLLDLVLFVSPPIALAFAWRARRAWAPRVSSDDAGRFALALAAALLLLDLSGLTRGEVGRIWSPLMPLIVVAATTGTGDDPAPGATEATALAATVGACTLLVTWFWRV